MSRSYAQHPRGSFGQDHQFAREMAQRRWRNYRRRVAYSKRVRP